MKVIEKDGRTREVNDCYGARLIEQGRAVPAPKAPKAPRCEKSDKSAAEKTK